MTDATLRQALTFAACGWPVLPCQPGQKIPATRHGVRDATTDPGQITAWFGRHPDWNLAIATGAPGPDVLDVDQHGDAGNGYAAFRQLRTAGLLNGARAYVRTPSGGLHAYFHGSDQRNGHLAAGLGPCWPAHDLCLYGLDIASELWSMLYLQPDRSPALVSAQAEYQARILPALADQLRIETHTCSHPRNLPPVGGQPWTMP